jgi:hypothetical protein
LRKRLGDDTIDFKPYGGYELFLKEDESSYNECLGNYRLSMKFYGRHLRLVFLQRKLIVYWNSRIFSFNPFDKLILEI